MIYLGIVWWTFIAQTTALYHVFSPKVYSIQDVNSLFGFSVAYAPFMDKIIISNPRASKIYYVDPKNESNPYNYISDGHEDESWYGATVLNGGNFFAACSPKHNVDRNGYTMTSGKCYINTEKKTKQNTNATPFDNYEVDKPTTLHNETNLDNFGWSMDLTAEGTLLIGSPIYFIAESNKDKRMGYVLAVDMQNQMATPHLIKDKECSANFGYSIASGNFLKHNGTYYAIGSTYGQIGEGRVSIYNDEFKKFDILTGEVGDNFGASLCAIQLKGEKKSLLVGAPTYTDQQKEYDRGGIYVYVPKYEKEFSRMMLKNKIIGRVDGGFFGFSMINIGDMTGDKMDEFAIAAPFEKHGEDAGVVYIYSGASLFSDKPIEPIQRLKRQGTSSFGYSLAPMNSVFNAGCKDLIIGDPFKNTVVVYHCLASFTARLWMKPLNLQNRQNQTYFEFTHCMDIMYPENPKTIDADIVTDVEITHAEAFLADTSLKMLSKQKMEYVTSLKGKPLQICQNVTVITPTNGNYENPITYKITARLQKDPLKDESFDASKVTLSGEKELELRDSIWATDCGNSSRQCQPELNANIITAMTKPYIAGQSQSESVSFLIFNKGETAYSACLTFQVENVYIVHFPPDCTVTDKENEIICKPTKTLRRKAYWNIKDIQIETKYLASNLDAINFISYLYNHCDDKNTFRNLSESYALEWNTEQVKIKGVSNPSEVIKVTPTEVTESKKWEHSYSIVNNGDILWADVVCYIQLPKAKYLKYFPNQVTVHQLSTSTCTLHDDEPAQFYHVKCKIGDIRQNSYISIVVPFMLTSDSLSDVFGSESQINITSKILFTLRDKPMQHSTTTTLQAQEAIIPLWIIIVAVLISILILFIIAFVLYKCGCFERKNKKKLDDLKESLGPRASAPYEDRSSQENILQEDGLQETKESDENVNLKDLNTNGATRMC